MLKIINTNPEISGYPLIVGIQKAEKLIDKNITVLIFFTLNCFNVNPINKDSGKR